MHLKNMTIISRAVLFFRILLCYDFILATDMHKKIHDNCLSCIFLLLIVISIIWNQGIIISMYITPSMKLSQLEMALGTETLSPGLLILVFFIATYYKVFKFHKGDGRRGFIILYIYTRLSYCTSIFWTESYINLLLPYISYYMYILVCTY